MSPVKRMALEKLAEMYKKHDAKAEEEVKHHPKLQAILNAGYTPHKESGDGRLMRFDKGSDLVIYDTHTNIIITEYTHSVLHKKPNIDYL